MRIQSNGRQGQVFIFTKESERFNGRSCVTIYKEHTGGSALTTSCRSAIKALTVQLSVPEEDILVSECNCTIAIPIQLNRIWSTDVDLIVRASTPSVIYNPSGESIRPAISGEDFHAISGIITITAGNTYENFYVDLISNSGDTKSYFNVEVVDIEARTICESEGRGSIKVVIEPTGV